MYTPGRFYVNVATRLTLIVHRLAWWRGFGKFLICFLTCKDTDSPYLLFRHQILGNRWIDIRLRTHQIWNPHLCITELLQGEIPRWLECTQNVLVVTGFRYYWSFSGPFMWIRVQTFWPLLYMIKLTVAKVNLSLYLTS